MIRTFLFKKLLSSFISHGPRRLLRYAFIVIFLILIACVLLFVALLSLAFFLFGELFDLLGFLLAYIDGLQPNLLLEKARSFL